MRTEILESIAEVPADEWNTLAGTGHPFLRHEFLAALESSGSASDATGWAPCHILIRDAEGGLAAAMPMYSKTNSWGEFVFDWAWADAYHRAGLHYYPKLVCAVPFTPAAGPRLLVSSDADADALRAALIDTSRQYAAECGASSLHILFPEPKATAGLAAQGLLLRKDCQFHWHNPGYSTFDDFLDKFTSAKRKKVRRERRRVAEASVSYRHLDGHDIDAALWEKIFPVYASSFWRRGREPYLNAAFFQTVARTMPEQLLVILAESANEPIGVAICFRGDDTLYGRYWGSSGRYHSLHFETCYYQGIDYCIAQGIRRFEPGTQGEHKLARGFEPSETWSAHWLSHPQFGEAIDRYIDREKAYVDDYMDVAREHVPYRRGE